MNIQKPSVSWARTVAEFRLMVIGSLLAHPPGRGELKAAIAEIALKKWRDPLSNNLVSFSFGTIERWYYLAKDSQNPVDQLIKKIRGDRGSSRFSKTELSNHLRKQYEYNKDWSRRLHFENLEIISERAPDLGNMPSYATLGRWMRQHSLFKIKQKKEKDRSSKILHREIFDTKESRSFAAAFPGSLWHLDFHHANRQVLSNNGRWFTPILLSILDDCSRIICHMQWYENETTDCLIHGFRQAMQKRGLPADLLNDNGSAMTSLEFIEGLKRLSISAFTTLPYCPEQNGKQERFFGTVEGRLMKMLDNKKNLTLEELNKYSLPWMEYDYNNRPHDELLGKTPMEVYLSLKNLHRTCPNGDFLNLSFTRQQTRKPRRFDSTLSIKGVRFDIPWIYRNQQKVIIRYQEWDLSYAWLMDKDGEKNLTKIYPTNHIENYNNSRRSVAHDKDSSSIKEEIPDEVAPLLAKMMADYAATGLPPAYIEKENPEEKNDEQ